MIAIENTRLLNELRSARRSYESLERQTATSEVLQVISSRLVILSRYSERCWRMRRGICDAKFGVLHFSEGDAFPAVALHNAPPIR